MAKQTKAVVILLLTSYVSAQTTALADSEELGPIPRSSAASKEWNARGWAAAETVLEHLASDDSPAVREAEVTRIKMLLRARPAFVTKNGVLLGLLINKKMHAELIDVADYGTACHPESTADVAQLQKYKALALTAMGKKDEGLAAAKAYFNVAPMNKTADSLKLLADTLGAADATSQVEVFKAEQTSGAEPVAADQLNQPRPRTSVLESIKIDASSYDKALADRKPMSYIAQLGRGNLLLLADRPAEALKAFESAQGLAGEKLAAEANENIARAMRAADGSIGRANAWVASLEK